MDSKIIDVYKEFLNNNLDKERSIKEKQYLYSPFKHYGIGAQNRKKFFNLYKKDFKTLSKNDALKIATKFWNQESFEEKSLALDVLNLHKTSFDKTDLEWIEDWARECYGWALLDGLIIPFVPYIFENDSGNYQILEKWIKDEDFWIRRSALLAQILLFRKSKTEGNRSLFFKLAKSQFDETSIESKYPNDKETRNRAKFFIRKAIGWTLREMSKKDPDSVAKFLKENKKNMSGLSYREGIKKLPQSYLE